MSRPAESSDRFEQQVQEQLAHLIQSVSQERFEQALDVLFSDRPDEEIEAWFEAQSDGGALSSILFECLRVVDPSDRARRSRSPEQPSG